MILSSVTMVDATISMLGTVHCLRYIELFLFFCIAEAALSYCKPVTARTSHDSCSVQDSNHYVIHMTFQ
jgi:hypothetical protein